MNTDLKSAEAPHLQWTPDRLEIGGRSEILLSASLFYFRIPRALWRERMEQTKAFGYNAIDVYFPWNYHEPREGEWDFAGERDVEAFLKTAAEVGLWVIARPGPYICSEWDGGALPAYLLAKQGVKLRENDPNYLRYVAGWFDRILPMLRKFEPGEGGTVIAVQLENELDFYGCQDPKGYISALRDMTLGHGISVPLVACAGQGGLYEASGFADAVMPTCNFYPNDRDPEFERKVAAYKESLAQRGMPLLVTETNRSHFLLRRLLSCGAKLLGPYLQVSGTDFGFTNATNNWGKPLAFLTTDYDFGGMISPEGHIRDEAYEGRLLSRLMNAYGSALAEAKLAARPPVTIICRSSSNAGPAVREAAGTGAAGTELRQALELSGGGWLVFFANVGHADERLRVSVETAAKEADISVAAFQCPILPVEVPLSLWGQEGKLLYSTAELAFVKQGGSVTAMVFHSESDGEIALRLPQPLAAETDGMSARTEGGVMYLSFSGKGRSVCRLALKNGHRIELTVMSKEEALLIKDIDEIGCIHLEPKAEYDAEPRGIGTHWAITEVDPLQALSSKLPERIAESDYFLENNGVYRGYAWYEAEYGLPKPGKLHGFLIREASDVLSLYDGGRYLGTVVPGGGSRFVRAEGAAPADAADAADGGSRPASLQGGLAESGEEQPTGGSGNSAAAAGAGRLHVRTEIWGHTNFDDARLPGLGIHSRKGLAGAAAVTNVRDLSSNWRMCRSDAREMNPELAGLDTDDSEWPIVSFGGWLTADNPAIEYYRRSFEAAADADCWTLHFEGIQAAARVFVNGIDAGAVDPFDPYVDITSYVAPGGQLQVAVFVERPLGLSAGSVTLYEGVRLTGWRLSGAEEPELLQCAEASRGGAERTELPLRLEPGRLVWMYAEVNAPAEGMGWRVRVKGIGVKLTAFFEGRLVGRLWLPGGEERPVMTGGSPDSFWLPAPWFREGGAASSLVILTEAVAAEEPSVIEEFTFHTAGRPVTREQEGRR